MHRLYWFGVVVTAMAVATTCACKPIGGNAQLDVPDAPWLFKDAQTGEVVHEVLVVPRYSHRLGVSTTGGDGPGIATDRVFVAAPFVYRAGNVFAPKVQLSGGAMIGASAYAGSATSIDGVLIIAPGYRPQWVWDLWSTTNGNRSQDLEPVTLNEAIAVLSELEESIHRPVITDDGLKLWSLASGSRLEVVFQPAEVEIVSSWLRKGVDGLVANQGLGQAEPGQR